MEKSIKNLPPDGYSTVCPYLMVENIEAQLKFLKAVFNADIMEELNQKDSEIMHGEARIGDTTIMMGKVREEYSARESMNYVFVENVDKTYDLGIKNGAISLMQPVDQFYGNREAGLKDSQGNQWWVATQIEKLFQQEMQERLDNCD